MMRKVVAKCLKLCERGESIEVEVGIFRGNKWCGWREKVLCCSKMRKGKLDFNVSR